MTTYRLKKTRDKCAGAKKMDPNDNQNPETVIKLREYQNEVVQKTLKPVHYPYPPLLQEAIDREYEMLDSLDWNGKVVLDVGCGEGRHGLRYGPCCSRYIGIDISEDMLDITRKNWQEAGLVNTDLLLGDADKIKFESESIDRVMSLFFTPGNFRKDNFDVSDYSLEQDINRNPKFKAIVSNLYQALKPGGDLLLTVYKDREETREMQKSYYSFVGMHVNSKDTDPFVSTVEGFWSVRWTEERMLSILGQIGIAESQVRFIELNDISWMVQIIATK
jgi:SAM-dependent methyltransferase